MCRAGVVIRKAGPGDLPSLLEFYRHLPPNDPESARDPAQGRFAQILARSFRSDHAFAGDLRTKTHAIVIRF